MKLQELTEGRFDPVTLSALAKRHFGSATKIENMTVIPASVNMSSMSGFMAEVKKLGMTAKWDASTKSFAVEEN